MNKKSKKNVQMPDLVKLSYKILPMLTQPPIISVLIRATNSPSSLFLKSIVNTCDHVFIL
jgi:hypothetical protein